jgi:hypothetical protein
MESRVSLKEMAKSAPIRPYKRMQMVLKVADEESRSYCAFFSIKAAMDYYYPAMEFSNMAASFDDLLASICPGFKRFLVNSSIGESPDETHEFLLFTEAILTILKNIDDSNFYQDDLDRIDQIKRMLASGLSSLNYKVVLDGEVYCTQKIDAIADAVKAEGTEKQSSAIDSFLRAKNYEEKWVAIKSLIDETESLKGECQRDGFFKAAGQFIQFARHPEMYRKKDENQWFYKDLNKEEYLNDLFEICLGYMAFDNAEKAVEALKEAKNRGQSNQCISADS